jgi:hypothetical protein
LVYSVFKTISLCWLLWDCLLKQMSLFPRANSAHSFCSSSGCVRQN